MSPLSPLCSRGDCAPRLTTWVGESFCLNSGSGMGVFEPANQLVSQESSAELRPPYYVKRNIPEVREVTRLFLQYIKYLRH